MRRNVFKVSIPENARLIGSTDRIELDFVEREATPRLLMKLGMHLYLGFLSLSKTVSILDYSVLSGLDQPLTTGFTKPIYSRKTGDARITLRLTRL